MVLFFNVKVRGPDVSTTPADLDLWCLGTLFPPVCSAEPHPPVELLLDELEPGLVSNRQTLISHIGS